MTFANPEWFFALLLFLPLAALLSRAAILRRKAMEKLTGLGMRSENASGRSIILLPAVRTVLIGLALVLLIVALARPQWGHRYSESMVKGRNVLIALDVSKSMRAEDVQPNRLGLARVAALHIVEDMRTDRLGVIGFAGAAHLTVPLTLDHAVVIDSIQQLSPESIPRGGSNLAAAIRLASDTFDNLELKGDNALIVLSDGEAHEGNVEVAITEAREQGVHIIAVGVGTHAGARLPLSRESGRGSSLSTAWINDSSGTPIISRLDSTALIAAADTTKGRYISLQSGRSVTSMVQQSLESLKLFELSGRQIRTPIDHYQWPMTAALLCLTASVLAPWILQCASSGALRKLPGEAATASVWVALFLILPTLISMDSYESFQSKDYQNARAEFQDSIDEGGSKREVGEWNLGDGASAYQLKDFRKSLEPFGNALLSEDLSTRERAHYNLGNTLFRIGQTELPQETVDRETALRILKSVQRKWQESLEHYDSALAIDSGNSKTKTNRNLEIVRERLRQLKILLNEIEMEPPPEKEKPQQTGGGGNGGQSKPGGDLQRPMRDPRTRDPNSPAKLKTPQGKDDPDGGDSPESGNEENRDQDPQPGDEAEVQDLDGEVRRLDEPGKGGEQEKEQTSKSQPKENADGSGPLTKEEARQALRKYADEVLGLPDDTIRSSRRNFKDW